MSSRRQFLGAAAAASGLALSGEVSAADTEADDLQHWKETETREFDGVEYSARKKGGFGCIDSPLMNAEFGIGGDVSKFGVELRESNREKPGHVTDVAFHHAIDSRDQNVKFTSFAEIDVATARELARVILKKTEPVTEVE